MKSHHETRRPVPFVAASALLGALLGALAAPGAAVAQEARCAELGSDCWCSEPLNNDDGTITEPHDFSDSPNATECNAGSQGGATSHWGDSIEEMTSTFPSLDYGGSDIPTHVLSSYAYDPFEPPFGNENRRDGGIFVEGDILVTASTQRACIRYYFVVTNDFTGVGGNSGDCPSERNKMIEGKFARYSQFQAMERDWSNSCHGPGTSRPYEPFDFTNQVDKRWLYDEDLDWNDCNEDTGWCRHELCVAGDLDGGNDLTVDSYITTLSDGQTYEVIDAALYPDGAGALTRLAVNMFHGQGYQPEGTRYVSHMMVAGWDTDTGQYIGAASEIEGGGDTGPPTSSPPTPNPITGADIAFSGVTSSEMTITVSNVTSAGGSAPIEYLFDCVSPAGCAFDSSWQASNVHNPTGMTPGTEYGWRITTRASAQNTGSASATFTQTTSGLVPPVLLD